MFKRSKNSLSLFLAVTLFFGTFLEYGEDIHAAVKYPISSVYTTIEADAKYVKNTVKEEVIENGKVKKDKDGNIEYKDRTATKEDVMNAGGYISATDVQRVVISAPDTESNGDTVIGGGNGHIISKEKNFFRYNTKKGKKYFYTNPIYFEWTSKGKYLAYISVTDAEGVKYRVYENGTKQKMVNGEKKGSPIDATDAEDSKFATAKVLHFGAGWNWYNYYKPSEPIKGKDKVDDVTSVFNKTQQRGYNTYALSHGRYLPCVDSLIATENKTIGGSNNSVTKEDVNMDQVSGLQKFILRPRSEKIGKAYSPWVFAYKLKYDANGNVMLDSDGDPIPDKDKDGNVYVILKPNNNYWNNTSETDVVVPNVVYDSTGLRYTVYGLRKEAFKNNKKITSVTIMPGVSYIGDWAFWRCTNLTDIKLNEGLVTIKRGAFKGTSITDITIPQSVQTLGAYAFMSCRNLTEVEITGADTTKRSVAMNNSGSSDSSYWLAVQEEPDADNDDPDEEDDNEEEGATEAPESTMVVVSTSSPDTKQELENNDGDTSPLSDITKEYDAGSSGKAKYAQYNGTVAVDSTCLERIGEKAFADTSIKEIDIPSTCYEFDRYIFTDCYKLDTIKIRYDGSCGKPLMIAPRSFSNIKPTSTINFWIGTPVDKVNIVSALDVATYDDNSDSKTSTGAIYQYSAESEEGTYDRAEFYSRYYGSYYTVYAPISGENGNILWDSDYRSVWRYCDNPDQDNVLSVKNKHTYKDKDGKEKTITVNTSMSDNQYYNKYYKLNAITAIQLSLSESDEVDRFEFHSFNTKIKYHSSTSMEDFYAWNTTHNSDNLLDRNEYIGNAYAERIENPYSKENVEKAFTTAINTTTGKYKDKFSYLNTYIDHATKYPHAKAIEKSGFSNLLFATAGTGAITNEVKEAIIAEYRQKPYTQTVSNDDAELCGEYFKRTGFEQIGWATSLKRALEGTVDYQLGASIPEGSLGNDGVLDLYAVWAQTQHKITLNYLDGTDKIKDQTHTVTVGYNDKLVDVYDVIPEREGYTFKGWYTEYDEATHKATGTEVAKGARLLSEEDVTYYAKWEAKVYKVTIKQSPEESFALSEVLSDGATFKNEKGENIDITKDPIEFYVKYGEPYSILAYKESSDSDKIVGYGTRYTSDGTDLSDKSTKCVADITGLVTNENSLFSSTKSTDVCKKDIVTIVDSSNKEVNLNALCSTAENHSVYLKYDWHKYNITYNFNSGKKANGTTYPSTYTVEDYPKIPQPTAPDGYIFAGWYREVSFTSSTKTNAQATDKTKDATINAVVDKATQGDTEYNLNYEKAYRLESSKGEANDTVPSKTFKEATRVIDADTEKWLDDGGEWVEMYGDIHLTAKFVPENIEITYTLPTSITGDVTFDINKLKGMEFEKNSNTESYSNASKTTLPTLSYSDGTYEFNGWKIGETEVSSYDAYTDSLTNGKVTVVADIKKKCSTVNYSVKAFGLQTEASTSSAKLVYDNSVTDEKLKVEYKSKLYNKEKGWDLAITDEEFSPATLTFDNDEYEFIGWYTDDSCTTEYKDSKLKGSSSTLYAKFIKKSYQIVVKNPSEKETMVKDTLEYDDTYELDNYRLPSDANLAQEDVPDNVTDCDDEFYVRENGWTVPSQLGNTDVDMSTASKETHVTGILYSAKGLRAITRENPEGEQITLDKKGRVVVTLDATKSERTALFDAKGGTLTGGTKQADGTYAFTYKYTEEYTNLPTPVKNGYKFLGWYKGTDLVTSIIATKVDPEGTTPYKLTAKWLAIPADKTKETYKVTYVKGLKDAKLTSESTVDTTVKKYGEKLQLATADCEGFDFCGWFYDEKLTDPVVGNELSETFNQAVTLYASWVKEEHVCEKGSEVGTSAEDIPIKENQAININFTLNMSIPESVYQAQYTNETTGTYECALAEASKFGYDFAGWYTDEALTKPFNGKVTLGKSDMVNLYAKFNYKGVEDSSASDVQVNEKGNVDENDDDVVSDEDAKVDVNPTTKPVVKVTPTPNVSSGDNKPLNTDNPNGGDVTENPNVTPTLNPQEDAQTLTVKVKKKSLGVKDSFNLGAKSDKAISYVSSNKKVATVTNKGKVTAKKAGTCTITMTAGTKKVTCKVTVKKAPSYIVVTSKTKLTLKKGKSSKIKYKLSSGSLATVTFKSSSKKIATVSSTGKVKAKKKGSCKITVKTHNGKKATIKVTVKK